MATNLITIPKKLLGKIGDNRDLQSMVTGTVANCTKWIKDGGIPFFPEYTDHGPRHIEDVLKRAVELIDDEAWEVFTAEDATLLILSVVLHDCGMHISIDGFFYILTHSTDWKPLSEYDDTNWSHLYDEFQVAVKRFDARKLDSIFGSLEPETRLPHSKAEINERNKLLVGEFLRMYHPRLAHEVAKFGIPGPTKDRLPFLDIPEGLEYYADLAGYVARSHGLSIRTCIDFLANKNMARTYKENLHPTYVMTLLRLSDYLQINPERAPRFALKIKSLESRASQEEWKKHEAIDDVQFDRTNRDLIFILAKPKSVLTYFGVRSWLDGIQYELDASWAALGEVYSDSSRLSMLGLSKRRIGSNLDDKKVLDKLPFEPIRAQFETNSPQTLKLLVGPLYNYDPSIGIRELVQNAVDAVNERKVRDNEFKQLFNVYQTKDTGHITVSVTQEDNDYWLEVRDCGVGMTPDTIVNYFLKAGASFRTSDEWCDAFNRDGSIHVLRSGRFGVGALAGFLLGDEIQITTRHFMAAPKDGVTFSARLNDDIIELNRVPADIGTTIRIKTTLNDMSLLSVAGKTWYCLPSPKVVTILPELIIEEVYTLPMEHSTLPTGWFRIGSQEFSDIQWTYQTAPAIVCNGIIIVEDRYDGRYTMGTNHIMNPERLLGSEIPYKITIPNISIFDRAGNLPINLQRTAVTLPSLSFLTELRKAIIQDFIGYALTNAPTEPFKVHDIYRPDNIPDHPGLCLVPAPKVARNIGYKLTWPKFLHTSRGCVLIERSLLRKAKIEAVLLFITIDASRRKENEERIRLLPQYFGLAYASLKFQVDDPEPHEDGEIGAEHILKDVENGRLAGISALPRAAECWVIKFDDQEDMPKSSMVWTAHNEPIGFREITKIMGDVLSDLVNLGWEGLILQYSLADAEVRLESDLARLWDETIGEPVIPYDHNERRRKFANAYSRLQRSIEYWSTPKQEAG